MTQVERRQRVLSMLRQLASKEALEGVSERLDTTEAPMPMREAGVDSDTIRGNIRNLIDREPHELSDDDLFAAEAIIIPDKRPVALIRNGTYDDFTGDWTGLNQAAVKARLTSVFTSIGRLELPKQHVRPYAGTGFVVGPNLLMTNRHVASLFSSGLGLTRLIYQPGSAAIDFVKEVDTPPAAAYLLDVARVVMIHPFWDMAILEVTGLKAPATPLRLSTARPEDLRDRSVVTIGYPAFDPRNDAQVQKTVFGNVFQVKRVQPGKLLERRDRMSFGKPVFALTHDCSTLGGNSGSAVVDIDTGFVVALHFSGDYLKTNYAVPVYELARDSRVLDAGVAFERPLPPPTTDWQRYWTDLEEVAPTDSAGRGSMGGRQMQSDKSSGSATWIVPVRVTVSVGGATLAAGGPAALIPPVAAQIAGGEESFQVPIIHEGLETRGGYNPGFLNLDAGEMVPLPTLTAAGLNVAAPLLGDGSHELKYHRFSVVIHKTRRLAIFTAANVDWRDQSRKINGHKPSRKELTGIPNGVLEQWVMDPRVSESHQIPDIFFTQDRQAFDKGHIVRRDDVAWGATFEDMQKGNGDTYHTTNCSPQTKQFNQATQGVDNWGDLESLVEQQTKAEKAIVLGGPVLRDNDRRFFGVGEQGPLVVRIPRKFWKIVVVKAAEGPRAFGFILQQTLTNVDFGEEFIVPESWKRRMAPISEIETALRGWVTLDFYKRFDQIDTEESVAISAELNS